MNRFASILTSGAILLATLPTGSVAQVADQALAEARSRGVCGAATLVSSTYLGNGQMRVTCRQQDQQQQRQQARDNPFPETGLTTPVAAGILATVVVIAAVPGGGDDSTTTTETSQEPSFVER